MLNRIFLTTSGSFHTLFNFKTSKKLNEFYIIVYQGNTTLDDEIVNFFQSLFLRVNLKKERIYKKNAEKYYFILNSYDIFTLKS